MPRKLTTYQTSLGFFDLAVAAPSMKAALQAWGSSQNLFHQGMARESSDPAVIAAAMAKPGIVLKRPVGSGGPFKEQADLPTNLPASKAKKPSRRAAGGKKPVAQPVARNKQGTARPDRRQERKPAKAGHKAASAADRRQQARAVAAARLALESAERAHRQTVARIERQRAELDRESRREASRWDKERERHEAALRRLAHK